MTTKDIINQMEKEFNRRVDTNKMNLFPSIRTLLESFGEEVIDIAQKHHNVAKDETDKGWCDHCSCLVTVLHEQRLKMKEIISSIGK